MNSWLRNICKRKAKGLAPKGSLQNFLVRHGLSDLKINTGFLQATFDPNHHDSDAAWELYIELLTRTTTQPLLDDGGDEKIALTSIYSLFPITREILRRKGRHCKECTKIAIVVLNQKIRPFTTKWHKLSLEGAFSDDKRCKEFRKGLRNLQDFLSVYSSALADLAGVEDLTDLENTKSTISLQT